MTSRFTRCALLSAIAIALVQVSAAAQVAGGSPLVPIRDMEPLPVLQRAKDVGPANPGETLVIAVSLPIAQPEAMQAFVDDVSNPKSPNYRQFISPEDVGARFGVSRRGAAGGRLPHSTASPSPSRSNRLAVVAAARWRRPSRPSTPRCVRAALRSRYEPPEFITAPRCDAGELAATVIDVCGLDTFTRSRALKRS